MRFIVFILSLLLTALALEIQAMPLSPESVERLKAEGRLEQVVSHYNQRLAKGVDQPGPNILHALRQARRDGSDQITIRCIVLLVDFVDNRADQDNYPIEHYEQLLFSEGEINPGSMREWYIENSYGEVLMTGEVRGWYRMPRRYSYYVDGENGVGVYPHNCQSLTIDAVNAANADVDFSQYDNDDNGFCDPIFVVHAGPGAENNGGDPDMIWSHSWALNEYRFIADGVYINRYTTEPEDGGTGVFGHEQGHAQFGLPDLYDRDYSSEGVGRWSMMASGSHNGNGMSPAHFDAWSKIQAGFITPVVIEYNTPGLKIQPSEQQADCYLLWKRGSYSNEYFLLENRQRTSFDAALPGSGLLIYHIDNNIVTQNDREWFPGYEDNSHYLVAIEQAEGDWDLDRGVNRGDAADPWPGALNRKTFDYSTTPNSRNYDGVWTGVAVRNIEIKDDVVNCDIEVGSAQLTIIQANYHMIGIPVIVPNGDASTLFQDDFANRTPGFPYWRLARWDVAAQNYLRYEEIESGEVDLGNPPDFSPGLGFWVAQSVFENCQLDIANEQVTDEVSYTERYRVPISRPNGINRGFTQLANPFHYPYDWRKTVLDDGAQQLTIAEAAGAGWVSGYAYIWDAANELYMPVNYQGVDEPYSLESWQGFWFEQLDDNRDIDVLFTPDGYSAPQAPRRREPEEVTDEGWMLGLSVSDASGQFIDPDNRIAVDGAATDGYDHLDAMEFTPMSSEFVHLYFYHPDWQIRAKKYTYDYRSLDFSASKAWDFTVSIYGLPDREFVLKWEMFDLIDDDFSFLLTDLDNRRDISDMRNQTEYRFRSGSGSQDERHFRVLVGKPGSYTPPDYFDLLTAFPNPFNERLNIVVNLPAEGETELALFDAQGRLVKEINQGYSSFGFHHYNFNAQWLASGLYLLKFKTSEQDILKKVVLVR